MKKILILILLFTIFSSVGCSGEDYSQYGRTDKGVNYENYIDGIRYDSSIFYQNNSTIVGADPSVITVGDEYYLYVTNSDGGDCSYIQGYKSKNLTDWEWLGRVFVPDRNAWAVSSLWAPEVVEHNGKYYMYYSGYDTNLRHMGIGLAVSDSPAGPFKEFEGTLANGTVVDKTISPFNSVFKEYDSSFKLIDPNLFIDDDGRIYLYVSQDQVRGQSSVYGMELESDLVSIKVDTLTGPLAKPSLEWENPYATSKWNEAPFMFKHNGKYYLLYSANFYKSSLYSIGCAVSTSPLGKFTKMETPLLSAREEWPYISGPGHCSIFPSVDKSEYYIAYHSHVDVENGGSIRKINFDKVSFVGDEMVVNGPSITPQLLPSGSSKYKNIAPYAEIHSNVSQCEILVDGVVNALYEYSSVREVYFEKKSKVTFEFASEVNVVAIMVYDSSLYSKSMESYKLEFSADEVENVYSNPNYKFVDEDKFEIKLAAAANIIQFEGIKTKKVTFTFPKGVSISEIIIVGGGI